jgi:UDP:flavonoid glycosyltransferase YjiC (YdhE family)
VSIGGAREQITGTTDGRDWAARRNTAAGFLRGFVRVATSLIETGIADYWHARDHADALIVTAMGLPVGGHIAERLRVPLIRISFAPTRLDWDGRANRLNALRADFGTLRAAVFRQLLWIGLRPVTNRARRNVLELPSLSLREPYSAMNARRVPVLDAYSASVVPEPPDSGSWIHVTGYWFLEESRAWVPPSDLVDFLKAGPPPVFVGFGSTPFPHPDSATTMVVDALKRVGQRGIVVAGESGLATGRLADDVLGVRSVPHSWLFPRVSAAVHHGGAGVTGAVLRAGLPSVVVPMFGDQPFWGKRLFDLGAAAPPIPARRLSADLLASAIRLTGNDGMRRRAAALADRIRGEDGIGRAIEAIQRHLASAATQRTSTGWWHQ